MLRLGTRPDRPRISAPPELIAASVSSSTVATDSGMSCRFSLRRVAVTTMSATPSLGSADGWVASAAGVSVSPVACANAGVAANALAIASAMSEVCEVRRIVVFLEKVSRRAHFEMPRPDASNASTRAYP